MATNPYVPPTLTGYNATPPPDDDSQGADNQVSWAKHKTKLGDPLKTFAEAVSSAVTTAFGKTINTDADEQNAIAGSLAFTATEVTLDIGGQITPTRTHHTVDTFSDAATDNLDTIVTTNISDGGILFLRGENSARVVTVRDASVSSGNIHLTGVTSLELDLNKPFLLFRIGTDFYDRNEVTETQTGQIGGLKISNNIANPNTHIDVAKGVCRDVADTTDLVLTAILTKQLNSAWVVGSGNGGLDTGTVAASTLYGVHLIKRTDTGVVDTIFSTDASAQGASVVLPANYDAQRLIGAVMTDGASNIRSFVQDGDEFTYLNVIEDVADATITSAIFEPATLSVPPRARAHIVLDVLNATENTTLRVAARYPGSDQNVGSNKTSSFALATQNIEGEGITGTMSVQTDSSSQIEYAAIELSGAATVSIQTLGYAMLTRRDP